jgi:1-acyl-sn-glycerol-3-phosphate acyltransferase
MPIETRSNSPDPRDKKRYYIRPTFVRRIVVPALKATFKLFSKTQVCGLEFMPTLGPVVLASNHLSNFDPFPVQFVIPRPIYYMAKAELHHNAIMDALLRQLGSFPVNRGTGDEWAMKHARQVLRQGQVLGIYPEGKRSKTQGLATARTGAARLALAAGCPIVPLAIDGTQRMFKNFPHRNPLIIRIGAPIYPEPDMSPLIMTDRMMFALAEMLPQDMRGVYAERPSGF